MNAIAYSDGMQVGSRTQPNGSVEKYILNHVPVRIGTAGQTMKRNIRELIRKLQVDEPQTFGLLMCSGFITEKQQAGLIQYESLTLLFNNPFVSHNPFSLHQILSIRLALCIRTSARSLFLSFNTTTRTLFLQSWLDSRNFDKTKAE
jgi:hypothetical protein